MKDDYLWDGSGEPDPEVQKLEAALGRYRHNQPAPAFDRLREIRPVEQRRAFFSLRWSHQLGAVVVIALLAAAVFLVLRSRPPGNAGPSWDVARLEGTPRVGWHAIGEKSGPGKLGIGQTLVTDNFSRATITLDETGRVEVDASSRLRVVTNGPDRKRLSLERGTIHATIWAPPDSRLPYIVHMVDRACVGKCFSFQNYEPASEEFRVRATEDNSIVATDPDNTQSMEAGEYIVQPEDLPMAQIYQCDEHDLTRLCIRQLAVGEPNGRLGYHPPKD